MKKRIFSMLVAAILLLGALAVNAAAENTTVVKEWSITLGDNIGANFYVNVPENAAAAVVKVTVAGQTNTYDLSEQTPVAEGLYKISVGVAAAQMTEDITLQLVADGTQYEAVSYSVREYAQYILAGNFPDVIKTLVKHMLDYGAAAQTFFEVNTDKLANDGYELDYTAQYPADSPELAANGRITGIRLYGASLVMDSKVAVRYYFDADSIQGVSFSANGVNYSAAEKDDMFYVEVPGIAPHEYADPIVLSAVKGEEKLEVGYCPLTYIVRMSQKGREEIKPLVNAMYGYYEAAIAYANRANVTVTLPAVTGGTAAADKDAYRLGDTVTLTVNSDAGYSQKLYINGQPLLLDWKTNQYSFIATEESYNITGGFQPSLDESSSDAARWDSSNQAHGIISTYYPNNSDSWWYTFDGDYQSISVKAKNYWPVADSQDGNGNVGFATILRVTMDNGNAYAFRVINDKGTYAYDRYGGNGLTGWGGWKNLSSLAEQFNGDGVDFKLSRTGDDVLTLSVNGTVMETYTMAGITADNQVASVSVQHNGNKGEKVTIPFVLEKAADDVKLNIADLTGGTVTAQQESYKLGDTVILTVSPDAGYSQKLYINGEPLLLDWKTNQYSFVAQKKTYNITGSFAPSFSQSPSDAARWDSSNQAHGIICTYYPNHNDSWWYKINGGYQSIAVTAKNYLPQADSAEGDGKIGYSFVLAATLDNGKTYAFRIINEKDSSTGAIRYIYTRYGASSCVTGWGGWCELEAKVPGVTEKLQADGAEFKLTRIGGNTLQITLDGVVLDTYTMDGVTDSNKVTSVGIYHYGNKGEMVEIPFTLVNDTDEAKFRTSDLSKYVIVYDDSISDYATLANQLKTQISEKYGVALPVVSDSASTPAQYEILLGDTNRYDDLGRVMEYSVTVSGGHFRIHVGGYYSAEKAIADLCNHAFNGQALSLPNGDYYQCSLLTASRGITSGTTARVMTANVLADAFNTDTKYNKAYYRAEIFAGMLVSYTPDVVGMQEVDGSWSAVLDGYLTKIAKTHGIQYSRYLATYEGKTNYTSLLYRSDKLKVENSGVKVFTWWTNSIFNHGYHMRNVSWAQFSSLTDTSKKFIVANTHWSYNGEHVGKTLAGSSTALQSGDLKQQCKDETNAFLTSLKSTYSNCPIFVTGDFNTALLYFTRWGWTAANYNVISQQAESNGTALSTVPDSGHPDHIFGTGSYTVKCYEFFNSVNQHGELTDHSFAYADLAF